MLQLGQDLLFAHDMIHLVMQLGLLLGLWGTTLLGIFLGGDHVVPNWNDQLVGVQHFKPGFPFPCCHQVQWIPWYEDTPEVKNVDFTTCPACRDSDPQLFLWDGTNRAKSQWSLATVAVVCLKMGDPNYMAICIGNMRFLIRRFGGSPKMFRSKMSKPKRHRHCTCFILMIAAFLSVFKA